MKVQTFVKDRVFLINCGTGAQKIRWLADVGALKYDPNSMLILGEATAVKTQDGAPLNLNDRICDRISDNGRVWLQFGDLGAAITKPDAKGAKKGK